MRTDAAVQGPASFSGMIVVALVCLAPAGAAADSLGDYKDEKHDEGGASGSGETEDEGSSVGEVLGDVLGALGDDDHPHEDPDHHREQTSSSTSSSSDDEEEQKRRPRACHFERYYGCMRECEAGRETCRRQCRRDADWLCGRRAPPPSSQQIADRGEAGGGELDGTGLGGVGYRGLVEMGAGGVEGGALLTAEHRFRSGNFGGGLQLSYMWSEEDELLETDLGPAAFIRVGTAEYGVQPSVLVSMGNEVASRAGAGMRLYADWRFDNWMLAFNPMAGVVNGKFNAHLRTAIGFPISSDVYLKVGHDFRWVRELSSASESGMHGGFLSIGYDFR